ncbi:BnaCnng45300D [Brassica napus]|uniref:BnaCnng45300D protein n=1 Tax=Brassica napus TaxID=3708 RepID=A0A078JHG0_BRANA|nr:BnaCnng45300D [Brassica napus]
MDRADTSGFVSGGSSLSLKSFHYMLISTSVMH